MKQKLTIITTLTLLLSVVSCQSGPNAQTGTVLGALGGAAAGGIIGHQSGRGLEGAVIGAGIGGLGGNMIGGAQDQRNAQYYNSRGYNQPQYQPQYQDDYRGRQPRPYSGY
jgi:uncharacterized membrane protein